jgi:hypothetical protein
MSQRLGGARAAHRGAAVDHQVRGARGLCARHHPGLGVDPDAVEVRDAATAPRPSGSTTTRPASLLPLSARIGEPPESAPTGAVGTSKWVWERTIARVA